MQQIYRRTYVIVFNKMFGYFKSTRIYLPVVIVITIYLTRCKIHSLSISRISNSPTKTLSFRPLSIRRPQGLCGKKSYFWSQNTILTVFLNRISFHILDRKCIKIFSLELYESGISASE